MKRAQSFARVHLFFIRIMQRQATFSAERRSSGRLRDLSKKYKVSTDATAEIKIERRNARLDFLENDNFVAERNKNEEDQEFVLEEDDGAGKRADISPA